MAATLGKITASKQRKTTAQHIPAGSRTEGYRSQYEANIARINPYLIYEPTTYNFTVANFELIPEAALIDNLDGTLTIDASWATRARNRKGDKPWVIRKNHTPDWLIPAELSETGRPIVVESKGLLTTDNRSLIRAFRASYPDIDYRMMFMKDEPIPKSSLTTMQWANRNNIVACVGVKVPRDWLNRG